MLDKLHYRLVHNLAHAYQSYDDCNPDVGMGWTFRNFLKIACMNSGFSPEDEAEVMKEFDNGTRY